MLNHVPAREPHCLQTARSVGDPKIHELNMPAQTATGHRHSRPHTNQSGSKPHKRPASRQLHASNSQSTGDCNPAEVGHLVDDHRLPPQNSARESIDGLCKQDTGSEGQLCTAGGWCPLKLQNAHDAHRSAFEVSSPDFRQGWASPRLSPG